MAPKRPPEADRGTRCCAYRRPWAEQAVKFTSSKVEHQSLEFPDYPALSATCLEPG